MKYNANVNELDNMFVHLTNVSIQKTGVRYVLFSLYCDFTFNLLMYLIFDLLDLNPQYMFLRRN